MSWKSSKSKTDAMTSGLEHLSGTELNTLLLDLFQVRAKVLKPAEVLDQFAKNRFSLPSAVNTIDFLELELAWLKEAARQGFVPMTLSSLAPLGACSVFGTIHQNNVVSATRGTEVVSDATNVLAFITSQRYKSEKNPSLVKHAVVHRHVRAQGLAHPSHTAHFGIFCLTTGGVDHGSFSFEMEQTVDHLNVHLALLVRQFKPEDLRLAIHLKNTPDEFLDRWKHALKNVSDKFETSFEAAPDKSYYQHIQFRIYLKRQEEWINLADGGTVDWTQQLLANKKHRFFISGMGIELVHKIQQGII
jgi:hypothetical protein